MRRFVQVFTCALAMMRAASFVTRMQNGFTVGLIPIEKRLDYRAIGRRRSSTRRKHPSKYMPHQGARECVRRTGTLPRSAASPLQGEVVAAALVPANLYAFRL